MLGDRILDLLLNPIQTAGPLWAQAQVGWRTGQGAVWKPGFAPDGKWQAMIPGEIRQLSARRLQELLLRELLQEKLHRVGLVCYPHYGDNPEKPDVMASYGPTTSLGVNEVYIVLPLKDKSTHKNPQQIAQSLAAIEGGRVPCISGYIVELPGGSDDICFHDRGRAQSYLKKERPARAHFSPHRRPVPFHELEMGDDQVRVGLSVCQGEKATRLALMDLIECLDGWQTRARKKKRPTEAVGTTRER